MAKRLRIDSHASFLDLSDDEIGEIVKNLSSSDVLRFRAVSPRCQRIAQDTVESLDLRGCQLRPYVLIRVASKFTRLKKLRLSDAEYARADYHDEVLEQLRLFTNLRSVSLHACGASKRTLAALSKCRHLRAVDLSHCLLADSQALKQLAHCHDLVSLRLDYCSIAVNDRVVDRIAAGCPKLREISLVSCHMLTPFTFISLAKHCRKLVAIDLSYVHSLANIPQAMSVILPILPNLEYLRTVAYSIGCPDSKYFATTGYESDADVDDVDDSGDENRSQSPDDSSDESGDESDCCCCECGY